LERRSWPLSTQARRAASRRQLAQETGWERERPQARSSVWPGALASATALPPLLDTTASSTSRTRFVRSLTRKRTAASAPSRKPPACCPTRPCRAWTRERRTRPLRRRSM